MAQGGELFHQVAANNDIEHGGNLAPERPGVERGELASHGLVDIPLRWVFR